MTVRLRFLFPLGAAWPRPRAFLAAPLLGYGFLPLVALFALGCNSVTTSEVTLAACTQGDADEDGDGLANCKDPDCFGFEECRLTRPQAGDGAGSGAAGGTAPIAGSAGTSGAGSVAPPPMGGATPPTSHNDASIDEEDAGDEMPTGGGDVPPVTDPCSLCMPSEECVGGECLPIPEPAPKEGAFTLYILSATAPVQTPVTTNCYDNSCPSGFSPPYGFCTCPPDPYVRVVLERGRGEITVGETEVAEDTIDGEYMAAFDLDLEPGDVLRYIVLDEDDPFSDELMYACTPNLAVLEEGPLDCETGAGFFGADDQIIRAELVARSE